MIKNLLVGTLLKTVLTKAKDEIVEEFVDSKLPADIVRSGDLKEQVIEYISKQLTEAASPFLKEIPVAFNIAKRKYGSK